MLRTTTPPTLSTVSAGTPVRPQDRAAGPTDAADARSLPYTRAEIHRYLLARQIHPQPTGDPNHDMCLFQAVLSADYFARIEAGQPAASDPDRARDTAYLLRRFDDLARPLAAAADAACAAFDALARQPPPGLPAAQIDRVAAHARHLRAETARLQAELATAQADPAAAVLSREKSAWFLVVHAMLADTALGIARWCADNATEARRPAFSWPGQIADDERMVAKFCREGFAPQPTGFFTAAPLAPAEHALLRKALTSIFPVDGVLHMPLPSVSRHGSQGLVASLYAVFHNDFLLTGASEGVAAVHGGYYRDSHLAALRHDMEHFTILFANRLLRPRDKDARLSEPRSPSRAARPDAVFRGVFEQLIHPANPQTTDETRQDLLVLFYLVHEHPGLFMPETKALDFLETAERFYRPFTAADTLPLLTQLGFALPPAGAPGSDAEKAQMRAVALAMTRLWQGFRARHGDELERQGMRQLLPRWF